MPVEVSCGCGKTFSVRDEARGILMMYDVNVTTSRLADTPFKKLVLRQDGRWYVAVAEFMGPLDNVKLQ